MDTVEQRMRYDNPYHSQESQAVKHIDTFRIRVCFKYMMHVGITGEADEIFPQSILWFCQRKSLFVVIALAFLFHLVFQFYSKFQSLLYVTTPVVKAI